MVSTRGNDSRDNQSGAGNGIVERNRATEQLQQQQQDLDRREQDLNRRMAEFERRERELADQIAQAGVNQEQGGNQNAPPATGNNVAAIGLVNMNSNGIDSHRKIKLPKLCANEPELWFIQIETIFKSYNIVSEADKTHAILANVDGDSLNCVKHLIIANPRPIDSYTQIKKGIIAHFSVSEEARVYQLLRGDVITSGKPSQILNHLRSLNSGNIGEEVLKVIFLTKLPNQHQLVLASASNISLNELAKKADQMAEVDRINNATVAAVTNSTEKSSEIDKIETLSAEVASLKTEFEKSYGNSRNYGYNRYNNYQNRGRGESYRSFRGRTSYRRGRSNNRGYQNNNRSFYRGSGNRGFNNNRNRSASRYEQYYSQNNNNNKNDTRGKNRDHDGTRSSGNE